jgi:glycosyltransferase involved in cell wall biosynthesis
MKSIKITHVATAYQSIVTILDSKLRNLNQYKDLDVTAISSSPDIRTDRQPAVRHITLEIARSIRPLDDLISIYKLYQIFRAEQFDIVHSHTAKAGFVAAIAAWLAKIPLVCHTYHGLPYFEGQNKCAYFIYRLLEKFACLFRHYIFTQNRRDFPECIKLIGSKKKVVFEGNGVDIPHIRKLAQEQFSQAKEDYPGTGFKLLLLSRLEPVKHVDDFFRVARKLKQEGIHISAVMAGAGPLENFLRNLLLEMNLNDCVNLLGYVDHSHGLLAAADIVCLCSAKEGLPRSLMEAMALCKPVVATDVLGTQELVVDNETGFLTPLADIDAMSEKIKLLAQNPNLRARFGTAGQNRITARFNEAKITQNLHNFYLNYFSNKLHDAN